jgi:hypothetical protein
MLTSAQIIATTEALKLLNKVKRESSPDCNISRLQVENERLKTAAKEEVAGIQGSLWTIADHAQTHLIDSLTNYDKKRVIRDMLLMYVE